MVGQSVCYTSILLYLISVTSVACSSQLLQVSHVVSQVLQIENKAYFHDDDTKETLRIPQTPDLEEEGWSNEVKKLLPPERSSQTRVLRESAPPQGVGECYNTK
jgi:hypothetical protein